MQKRTLGRSGLEVSALGLGCITKHQKLFIALLLISVSIIASTYATAGANNGKSMSASRPSGQPTLYPGGVWEPGPAKYGATIVRDVPVKMDDGVVLNATIAYPTDMATGQRASGRFPVVVEHTPYVTLGGPVEPNTYLTEHGYIYAVVRARGLGKSGGEVQFWSQREGLDGKAIVEWAARTLEGSDGRVGLIGCSWPGGIALTDSAFVGPESPLKATVAACVGLENILRQSFMVGGVPTMGFWNFTARAADLTGNSAAGTRFFNWMQGEIPAGGDPAYAGEFWKGRMSLTFAQRIVDNGVPVLLWSSWGDIVENGTVRAYTALQNAWGKRPLYGAMTADQPTSPRYQIIMGNWKHAEGLDAGIYLQWMETWLKGVDTGIGNTSTPMHLFEPGTERWFNAARYPLVENYTNWHLDAGGMLTSGAPARNAHDKLVWGDPAQAGSKLTFTTLPFTKGATLAGPISATFYASSSNTNLELIARLYDVSPDGSVTLISRGTILGSQRELDDAKSWRDGRGTVIWPWPKLEKDDYLTPGEIYRFDIALAARQWGVAPYHSLRLELTTQTPALLCPQEGLPPLNDNDPCRLTAPQLKTVPGATYTIYYGAEQGSTLNLPQLSWQSFPAVRSGVVPTPWSEHYRRMGDTRLGDKVYTLPLDWGNDR